MIMEPFERRLVASAVLAASLFGAVAFDARADAIIDWNAKSEALITESKLGTPPAIRVMALVQTGAYDAVNAITQRYPDDAVALAAPNASVDAAVAAAHRAILTKLLPAQQNSIDAAYQEALAGIADGPTKAAGIAVGEKVAAALLAQRADDGVASGAPYRPHAAPGAYVPTVAPAAPNWGQ